MPSNKSYDGYVLGLYEAMFSDIVDACPSLRRECERDYKRLLSAVKEHGVRFVFETLPSFGKHFDKCLADERLTLSYLCHFGPYKSGVAIPRLFKGLLLRVFDSDGVLRSDPDVQSIRFVRQLCSAFKRFRVECDAHFTWEQVNEFIKTDGEIVPASLSWDMGDFDVESSRDLHLCDHVGLSSGGSDLFGECLPSLSNEWWKRFEAVQRTADIVSSLLGRFNPLEWRARHGPGAVADLRSGAYKYDFPAWPARLERVFPYADFAFANYAAWADASSRQECASSLSEHEAPARLIAVPKAFTGPRLIASEPVAHQWCQQIIRDFLMTKVRSSIISSSIKFEDQTWNGRLALEASRTGSHATIDLSSASDRISCWLVERIFRSNPSLLEAFYSVRTRWLRQDIDKNNERFLRLRKFSTMGSALTFPVQSLVFAIIAIANLLYEEGRSPSIRSIQWASRQVRVFGDDIIVPTTCYDSVVETLEHLGLKVNRNKTFGTGKFRESCGFDGYDGHDVTRVSIMEAPHVSKPASVLSLVDTHNNLYIKGWLRTATFVRNSVASLKRYAFPDVEPLSGAVGWFNYDGFDYSSFKKRWNSLLHVVEYRLLVPKGSSSKVPVDSDSMVLQYFTEVTKPPISREVRLGASPLRHPLKLRWMWVQPAA